MQFFSHLLVFGTLFVFCMTDKGIHNLTYSFSKCGEKEKASTLLDVSTDFINKAKNLYPNCVEDELNCGQKEKSLVFLDVAMKVISEVKKGYPTCPEFPKYVERPMDCSDILRSGKNESGVYSIWPKSRISKNKSLAVYCDMDTDGGGWTVIQRRGKFSTPKDYFYKDWESYKNGFGNLTEEFWIGNDNIFAITNQATYSVRFDLRDAEGKEGFAEYKTFWIEEENANYTLHVDGHKGNVGDSFKYHDGMKFSTKDRRNDPFSGSACAVTHQGAWWYKTCSYSNLNGLYQPGIESLKSFFWYTWTNKGMGLSEAEIKLR